MGVDAAKRMGAPTDVARFLYRMVTAYPDSRTISRELLLASPLLRRLEAEQELKNSLLGALEATSAKEGKGLNQLVLGLEKAWLKP